MSTLWITRTQPSAQRLAEQFAGSEVDPWVKPLLEIEPVPEWDKFAHAQGQPELVVVTSQHAARQYVASPLAQGCAKLVHVALGAATAAVLEGAGITVDVPSHQSSEGVLAMGVITELSQGSLVWVIAGEGGRDVLHNKMAEQGVRAVKFATYRRLQAPVPPLGDTPDLIEISSYESLKLVFELFPAARDSILVVASERLANAAVDLGASKLELARGAEVGLMKEAVIAAIGQATRREGE